MNFGAGQAVLPAFVLLPLLILYGSLLGDIWVSLVALVGVLSIYATAWCYDSGLDRSAMLRLSNLSVVALLAGAASLSVWLRHSRLEKMLDLQAEHLRMELDTRLRVQALVTHDIRNPLTALINAVELDDPHTAQEMALRIAGVVNSTDDLATGLVVAPSTVRVGEIWSYVSEVFAARVARKSQRLAVIGDPDLVVETDLAVLCNSVLGNLLSNAIKFSPCGSTIEMVAEPAGDFVRIAVPDKGPGLPDDVVHRGPNGRRCPSRPGTEGETGNGYGLCIAALCAARLDGWLEVRIGGEGGAVSVLLRGNRPSDRVTPA